MMSATQQLSPSFAEVVLASFKTFYPVFQPGTAQHSVMLAELVTDNDDNSAGRKLG